MNARATEAAYVGDVFRIDVLGARAAGLRAILIDPHGFHAHTSCERVASVAGLADLLR